jgi:MerR family transcriptional regulator, mercuric resistance operon regulatory protein
MRITIGKLAERSEVKVETIRYYERIGLIPIPIRTEGRHRLCGGDDVKRVTFIRRSRELGFSLDDIRHLLALDGRGRGCGEVRQMTLAHAARLRDRIADLERMERLLRDTASRCKGGEAPECPILDVLGRWWARPVAAGGSRPFPRPTPPLGCRRKASTRGQPWISSTYPAGSRS